MLIFQQHILNKHFLCRWSWLKFSTGQMIEKPFTLWGVTSPTGCTTLIAPLVCLLSELFARNWPPTLWSTLLVWLFFFCLIDSIVNVLCFFFFRKTQTPLLHPLFAKHQLFPTWKPAYVPHRLYLYQPSVHAQR